MNVNLLSHSRDQTTFGQQVDILNILKLHLYISLIPLSPKGCI